MKSISTKSAVWTPGPALFDGRGTAGAVLTWFDESDYRERVDERHYRHSKQHHSSNKYWCCFSSERFPASDGLNVVFFEDLALNLHEG